MNYNSLMNKPTINYRELIGDNSVTEVGGITEEQFNTLLTTDLSSYYTKVEIDDLFSRSYVYREKSGSIVTFDCPSTSQNMPSLTVGIEAVQDLHGYDNPWPAGGGKNKLPMTVEGIKAVNTYHSWSGNSTTINNVTITIETDDNNNVTGIKFNGTASADITFNLANNITIPNGSYIWSNDQTVNISNLWLSLTSPNIAITLSSEKERNVTVSNGSIGSAYIYASLGNAFNNVVFKPMIHLATVSDATFAPYSNICPISGWSAVNVVVSPTTDVEDGTTYTTTLKDGQDNPLTCYGGELSNVNGVQTLELTHGYRASYNGETLPATWISDRDVYAEGTTPTIGAEVVYELATPQTIPQDSLSIASSAGVNNIWCDSGDITVKALDRIIQG